MLTQTIVKRVVTAVLISDDYSPQCIGRYVLPDYASMENGFFVNFKRHYKKNLRCLVMFASIPFKLLIFVTFNLIFDEQVFFSNLILQYARDTCISSIISCSRCSEVYIVYFTFNTQQ